MKLENFTSFRKFGIFANIADIIDFFWEKVLPYGLPLTDKIVRYLKRCAIKSYV